MIGKDTLWKGIIEDLVEEFIHFFYSDYADQIDFERGFAFLDKELEQLSPQSESKLRHADKLIQAYLKDGMEQWFLIHLEVQGYSDPDFAFRMFQYAYRIRDRYGMPITALAIFTDTNRQHHYSEYEESFFGTETLYRFRTFILMDYKPKSLTFSKNIFGLVLEAAHLDLALRNKGDNHRLIIKMKLVRQLLRYEIKPEKIRKLLNFIKFYINFDKGDYFHKFEEGIQKLTKSRNTMGIEEAIIQELKEKGLKEGLKEGLKKGLKKGREESIRAVITRAWKKEMPAEEIADLVAVPVKKVEAIIEELTREGK